MKNSGYLAASIAALVTFIVFAPAARNGFVDWDDTTYVVHNLHITSFDFRLFAWAFTDISHGVWIPLTWVSFAFDYAFWGLNPFGYHLVNIFLHAVNVALVCVLAARLLQAYLAGMRQPLGLVPDGRAEWFGLLAGLFFGLHPLRVESVAWITERKDLLSGLFGFSSLIMYINYALQRPPSLRMVDCFKDRRYSAALVFFMASLASKPMTITLPFVLIVLDWFPLGRFSAKENVAGILREKAPFVFWSVAAGVMNMFASTGSYGHVTIWSRMISAGRSLITYLVLMVYPERLAVIYDHPGNMASLKDISYLVPVVLFFILTACALAAGRRQKIWIAVWLAYLTALLPTLGIFTFSNSAMNDRYTYFALVWPTLLAALGIIILYSGLSSVPVQTKVLRVVLVLAVLSALVYYAVGTRNQIMVWNDTESLWSNVIDKRPGEAGAAYYERGYYYYDIGKYEEALQDEDKALEIVGQNKNKRIDNIYFVRGKINIKTSRYKEAVSDFTMAIERNPYKPVGSYYAERAVAFNALGMDKEADADIAEAERIKKTE